MRLNLSLYPNPNAGSFTLTYAPQPKAGMLEVYDLHGRCVHTAQVPPWSQLKRVELPAMPAGVYLCRLRFGASIATQRLVISAP